MVKKIKEETVFKGRRLTVKVEEYENNKVKYERECVYVQNAVIVVAVTDEGKLLFVREHREAINKDISDLPAGLIEEKESPLDAARRELEEETGYRANTLKFLRRMYLTCGYSSELVYIYFAKDLVKTEQDLDADEFLVVEEKTPEEARKMLDDNEIITASGNVGLMSYFLYLEKDLKKEKIEKQVEEVKSKVKDIAKKAEKTSKIVSKEAVRGWASIFEEVKNTYDRTKEELKKEADKEKVKEEKKEEKKKAPAKKKTAAKKTTTKKTTTKKNSKKVDSKKK